MFEEELNDLQNFLGSNKILLEQNLNDLPEWDSFNMLAFIVDINEKYNVNLSLQQISDMWSVKDLCQILYTAKRK